MMYLPEHLSLNVVVFFYQSVRTTQTVRFSARVRKVTNGAKKSVNLILSVVAKMNVDSTNRTTTHASQKTEVFQLF